MADVDYNELAEYVSDEEGGEDATEKKDEVSGKDQYVSIHASSFQDFVLKPELSRAIADCGFEHPSEVQHECLPRALYGQDVLCQAKSGMGKTAVFVLAVLQQINHEAPQEGEEAENDVQCLVMCHTRELAYQIRRDFDRFRKYMPTIRTAVFYGGVLIKKNIETLKTEKPQIVIGTPGRIKALVEAKHLNLGKLKFFVLDEADTMLAEIKMRRDVQQIFRTTPHEKQVMMFSATFTDETRTIAKKFMHNPHEIYITDGSKLTLHGLKQYYVQLEEKDKNRKLVDLLDTLEFNQCVIFVKSVSRAKELNRLLGECKFPSIAIHSAIRDQEERLETYKQFKEFRARIIVATDIFGRGIDVERVNVVIQYDLAGSSDQYLHRVGRAGRFGTKGLAISFVSTPEDGEILNEVQSRFAVSIPPCPDEIPASSYMSSG